MDPLSDLLRVVRLDGAFFYPVEAAGTWNIEIAAAEELTPRILPGAEHLISYHILTEGRCYGGLVGEEPVELVPGDVILFPQGDSYVMSNRPGIQVRPYANASAPARYPETIFVGDKGPRETSFVCGFLGCDRRPFNPLLAALPRQMHVRGVANAWLGGFTRQIAEESRAGRAGAETVVTRLAEVMFIEVLRHYLDGLPAEGAGWLAGLRDEVVGRVLALLHSRPNHPWTLDELARRAALLRTAVAKRFVMFVGQPPMQYLAQLRMQMAANLLIETSAKVAAIGTDVGYDSEAAFSRAFKKSTGYAPGAWREARRVARV